VRDVVLDPARLIMFHEHNRIAETRYLVDDHDYWRKPSPPREVREVGPGRTVAIGFNLAFRNYHHWLMQCLPAIDYSVRTIGAPDCILALPPLAAWQEETLAMLGYAGVPRIQIEPDVHYHFRSAHYCTYLNGTAEDFLSPRCLDVIDRLAAQVEPVADAPERLYVARLDSGNRVIRNESEVASLLARHGFTTLIPGYFAFKDQIGLFRSARIIVGGHGAGLTNLAFCEPGATVLELLQSTYPELMINRIAQTRGLRYHAECFESPVHVYVHEQDWFVDTKRLERKLPSLMTPSDFV